MSWRCLVLIPAYNEREHIAGVVQGIRALGYETLVVDDGSTDGTGELLKSLDTHYLLSSNNRGKGAAIRLGFQWFLEKPYDVLVMVDADGQHEATEIGRFLEHLKTGGADLVVGNRMSQAERMPAPRYWTNRLMSAILSSLAKQEIPDTQCGFRAIKRSAVEKIHLRHDRFEVESEMLLEAARQGFRIDSLGIRSIYKGQGSHIRPVHDTIRFIRFLSRQVFRK